MDSGGVWVKYVDHLAHLAPLQAEIERLNLQLELSYESHKQTLQKFESLTAKVVLPERRDEDSGQSDADYNSDCGWNACLYEVAKLNGMQS